MEMAESEDAIEQVKAAGQLRVPYSLAGPNCQVGLDENVPVVHEFANGSPVGPWFCKRCGRTVRLDAYIVRST